MQLWQRHQEHGRKWIALPCKSSENFVTKIHATCHFEPWKKRRASAVRGLMIFSTNEWALRRFKNLSRYACCFINEHQHAWKKP